MPSVFNLRHQLALNNSKRNKRLITQIPYLIVLPKNFNNLLMHFTTKMLIFYKPKKNIKASCAKSITPVKVQLRHRVRKTKSFVRHFSSDAVDYKGRKLLNLYNKHVVSYKRGTEN
jgi:hypothetical protein